MKTKLFSIVIAVAVCLSLVATFALPWARPVLAATIWNVYEGESIQAAVDAASARDTILVHPGIYYEHISISDTPVVLMSSDGPESTIIDGQGSGDPIITNDPNGSIIRGFTIRNSGEWNWSGGPPAAAIIVSASNCVVEGNVLTDTAVGIYLSMEVRGSNVIRNNVISGSREGILLLWSSTNLISQNTIHDCANTGIFLIGGFVDLDENGFNDWQDPGQPPSTDGLPCENNFLYRNTIYNIAGSHEMEVGIVLFNCRYTTIAENEVYDAGAGIAEIAGAWDPSGDGYSEFQGTNEGNRMSRNNIHDNAQIGIMAGSNGAGDIVTGNHVYKNGQAAYQAPSYGGPYGGVQVGGSNMTLTNNVIESNWGVGVAIGSPSWEGSSTQHTLVRGNIIRNNGLGIAVLGDQTTILLNDIRNNTGPGVKPPTGGEVKGGIYIGGWGRAPTSTLVTLNNIVGNSPTGSGSYGLYNANTAETVRAQFNWWGSRMGPSRQLPDNSWVGSSDKVSGHVAYKPWLRSAVTIRPPSWFGTRL